MDLGSVFFKNGFHYKESFRYSTPFIETKYWFIIINLGVKCKVIKLLGKLVSIQWEFIFYTFTVVVT